jgi:alpha-beta hydrolase superfamily lysophospholipase
MWKERWQRWRQRRVARVAVVALAAAVTVIAWRCRPDPGARRFYRDQTYHHQVLRALDHAAAQGADVTEVLAAIKDVHAGDADGWYAAWTALGDRNLARARATRDPTSRGQALLRAHTYYLRAEFFLAPEDPRRPGSFAHNTAAFYEGLDTLGVAYEKIVVPYGDGHHLNAVFYPAPAPARAPLIVFCGGYDSTMEELYFFLVAAARARGYSVLTFEGPGQGSVLREQGLPFTPAWEKPTGAVLDAYLAAHPRPAKMVMVGLSMGGYLAPRAAAFDERIDAVVSYDVFFDGAQVARRTVPAIAFGLRSLGLEGLVDLLAGIRGRFDPGMAWTLSNGRWAFQKKRPLDVADAASEYTLAPVAGRIRQDVLVLAGTDDQFVPVEQVDAYRRALVNARSVTTHVYDEASGGAEHSQLGASTLWQADFFDWMAEKME